MGLTRNFQEMRPPLAITMDARILKLCSLNAPARKCLTMNHVGLVENVSSTLLNETLSLWSGIIIQLF